MMKYILGLILLSLLAGCQTNQATSTHQRERGKKQIISHKKNHTSTGEQDGAPPGPIPRFFQKIFPVHAPLSRYGNPDVYRVKGQTYQVLKTSNGYRARGLASWYGTKFHRKRTSSGESYNMYALTAAHKTLPLPTYVRVTNLRNRRVAVVRVNDRGPFHRGRIIDLSYAAAAKLGLMPNGTAPVEVEALTTTGPGKRKSAQYYLQAGAFQSLPYARSFREKLSRLTSARVYVESYQKRHVVRIGPLVNKQMMESVKAKLARYGIKGLYTQLM